MPHVAQRVLHLVLALGLAACSNPASPVHPAVRTLEPENATRDEIAPNGEYCRSGYNVAQGRCN